MTFLFLQSCFPGVTKVLALFRSSLPSRHWLMAAFIMQISVLGFLFAVSGLDIPISSLMPSFLGRVRGQGIVVLCLFLSI